MDLNLVNHLGLFYCNIIKTKDSTDLLLNKSIMSLQRTDVVLSKPSISVGCDSVIQMVPDKSRNNLKQYANPFDIRKLTNDKQDCVAFGVNHPFLTENHD